MGSQPSEQSRPTVPDGRTALWRAHNGFRVITLVYAMLWVVIEFRSYARPGLALAEILIMTGWTVFTFSRYRSRSGRTNRLVFADQLVVTGLMLSNHLILSPEQTSGGFPSVVTLWHSTMITAAAVHWGTVGGGVSGLIASLSNFLLRWNLESAMWNDTLLMLGTGLVLGLASDTARSSTERLARALRAEATTAERERLARSIHDSVLQVLARVRRRGNELGGEAAELAILAGEQEIALRTLVATVPPEHDDGDDTDLASKLQVLRTPKVHVSVPGTAVPLVSAAASELLLTVREALENVERHAGADARAWLLLEDLSDEIVISVRDDGPGIADGRLGEAAAEGRMGVAQSIRARVRSLGGTVSLDTAPGEGTEWEIRVPRGARTSNAGVEEERR